jgi:L-threonylcarbamoyladenylate synthase
LFASVEEARKYVEFSEKAEELAGQHLPGPLTLVVPGKCPSTSLRVNRNAEMQKSRNMSEALFVVPIVENGNETIGVRVSSHPVARQLAESCGVPLSTTSANVHGKLNPYSAEQVILQYFEERLQPDLLLESGEIPETEASTVVEVIGDEVRVLREGGIKL